MLLVLLEMDNEISKETMYYIITYMNRIYLSKAVDEAMSKEIKRLLTKEGVSEREQLDYWDFYQRKENYTMDDNDWVIDFKPFEKTEMDYECFESNFRIAGQCCANCEFSEKDDNSICCNKRKSRVGNTTVCDLFKMKEILNKLEKTLDMI